MTPKIKLSRIKKMKIEGEDGVDSIFFLLMDLGYNVPWGYRIGNLRFSKEVDCALTILEFLHHNPGALKTLQEWIVANFKSWPGCIEDDTEMIDDPLLTGHPI